MLKKSRRPTAQAELSFIFNLLLALQAKLLIGSRKSNYFSSKDVKVPAL